MTDKVKLKPRPGIAELELDDQLVLFAGHASASYVLNTTAAFIWRRLKAGRNLDAVVSELTGTTGVEVTRVRCDVDCIVDEWLAAGLIGGVATRVSRDGAGISARLADPAAHEPGLTSSEHPLDIEILDAHFEIHAFDRAIVDAIADLFHTFRIPPRVGGAVPTRLFLRETGTRWRFCEEARELASCASRENVLPLVHTYTLMLGYLRSAGSAAVHGAALSSDKSCVLMPGASGSGKSTLAAALAGAGFACLADDIAVLTDPPVRLRPLPARIALKQSSWPLLSCWGTQLDALPDYELTGGRSVKYLRAPVRGHRNSPEQVTHLVFPRYAPGGRNALLPLSKAEAYTNLFAAGHDLKGPLSESRLRVITDWLRQTPCFRLEFADLDAGVGHIGGLLA